MDIFFNKLIESSIGMVMNSYNSDLHLKKRILEDCMVNHLNINTIMLDRKFWPKPFISSMSHSAYRVSRTYL